MLQLDRFLLNSHLYIAAALFSTAALTGCAGLGSASFPDASVNAGEVSLGNIQGSNFGGHAPLVGSHIFVLQPNTGSSNGDGTTGYGAEPKSLLGPTSTSGYSTSTVTTANSNGGAQVGWYYITTDLTGSFNISGDYTCTAGVPVYLYAYGGSPSYPSANNTFNISSVTTTAHSGGGYDTTFTTTATENAYIGEPVSFAGLGTGNNLNQLNSPSGATTYPITAVNLTTKTFSIFQSTSTASTYSQSGATATLLPNFNNGVVNVAVLGNCPNSGTNVGFGNSISYVYMNEVSTAAWAYAFQGFSLGNSNSAYIGAPPSNLAGLQNAGLNAAQLYDIQGSSITTSYAGEGHIARQFTPNGNGIVPQSTLDTVGNILAACVDSQNTAPAGGQLYNASDISAQCATLFSYATADGTPVANGGQQPYDTATAALNIARNPAGKAAYSSTFLTQLYTLPTANVPFTPHLTTQPSDFAVGILYPNSKTVNGTTVSNSYLINPESIAIDASGNVWFDNAAYSTSSHSVIKWSPQGVLAKNVAYNGEVATYVSIDPSGNAWVGNATDNSTSLATELNNAGAFISTGNAYNDGYKPYTGVNGYAAYFQNGYSVAVDGIGYAYFADGNNNNGYRLTQMSTVGAPTTINYATAMASCFGNGADTGASGSPDRHIDHMAVDSKANGYNVWMTSEGFQANADGVICKVNSSGNLVTGFTTSLKGMSTTSTSNEFISIDASGNAWIPSGYNATPVLIEISPTGGYSRYSTGATLGYPFGSTIDGNNTVWVADRGNGTVANFSIANAAFVSPSTNYKFSGSTSSLTSSLLNIAVDPSGDLWATDNANSNIVEIIGIAAPSYTPLSRAALNNAFGTKP